MLVTIVIPVYNRATIVPRTLASVKAQTHRPLELVLVDNDSSDDSLQVLREFQTANSADDFSIAVMQETGIHTAAAARQTGFEHATGDYVVFYDSDDVMSPDLIAGYVDTIARHPGIDIVHSRSTFVRPDGSSYSQPFHKSDLIANQILHSLLSTQRYIVRREFFARSGGWDTGVRQWDDWELGLRLLLLRPTVVAQSGPSRIFIISSGEESITGTEFASRAGNWELAIDKNVGSVRASSLTAAERRRYERLLEFCRLTVAAHYAHEGRHELSAPLREQALAAIADTYADSTRYRLMVKPVLKVLYRHIAAGRRGAARVARLLL